MTYAEKLKDPRWQKKRLEILKRDKFTCQYCLDKESPLNIHHFCYPKSGNPWDSEGHELITICENCHSFSHTNPPKIIEDLFSLLIINPKKHFAAIRLLVRCTIQYYKQNG